MSQVVGNGQRDERSAGGYWGHLCCRLFDRTVDAARTTSAGAGPSSHRLDSAVDKVASSPSDQDQGGSIVPVGAHLQQLLIATAVFPF